MEKICKENKEETYSEPGCLCAPFVLVLGTFFFIVKMLGKEIRAEKEDIQNRAVDAYFPEDTARFNQRTPAQKRGRF